MQPSLMVGYPINHHWYERFLLDSTGISDRFCDPTDDDG
jgi:hypothetical protein